MTASPTTIEVFAPAKVNLFLAITGLRPDGFHDLLSLVAPLQFGDTLGVRIADGARDSLQCDFPDVPTGPENLVLRAAFAFREATKTDAYFDFELKKVIPAGAGLGGGSSDASSALLAMNTLTGHPLGMDSLKAIAASLGSDCPLFLEGKATVMSGRGEFLESISERALNTISGQRLAVFRPGFGVSTAWAYGTMKAANGAYYLPMEQARAQLTAWLEQPAWEHMPLINNLQDVVFQKYLALPALLNEIREKQGLRCMMSGSGSSCFALLNEDDSVQSLQETVTNAWGEDCFFTETCLV